MIRQATRYDIPRLLEIVEAYAFENPIKVLGKQENHDPAYVEQLLFNIMQGKGFIYISPDVETATNKAKDLPNNIWSKKENALILTLVLQHELGHVLGIQHSNVQGDIWQLMSVDFVENLILN